MSPEDSQSILNLLNENNFHRIDTNIFYNGVWFLRIWYKEFEIWTDPEDDTRYYKGTLEELEYILNNI